MNTDATKTLDGWRVLVTRPAHQAENLCRLVEERGGKALKLPLISIEPLAHTAPVARLMESAREWDGWIFTSVNAVRSAEKIYRGDWCVKLAAVGQATAAALEAGGREIAIAPIAAYSGEALLALPEFQSVRDKRFLLVTGEKGLDVIARGLQERAAKVDTAIVYRRVLMPYDETPVLAALRGTDALVITSGEALQYLVALTPPASRATLFKKLVVVPSERVIEMARNLGFNQIHAPAQMADAQIVALLEQLSSRQTKPEHD